MRILNNDTNKILNDILIVLTKSELIELSGYLEELLNSTPGDVEHFHLNNHDYSKEITISLYDESNLSKFDERIKKLILKDE